MTGNTSLLHRLSKGAAQIERRQRFALTTGIALITWLYLLGAYRKWSAQWGCINVLILAILLAIVLNRWLSSTNWFTNQEFPTPWRFMILPIVGFVFCAYVGIYFTEPIETGGTLTRSNDNPSAGAAAQVAGLQSLNHPYDFSRTRAGRYDLWSSFGNSAGGASDVSVGIDDEGALFILLIALVLALICGSGMIPHFWILATFLLLVIMATFTYREWQNRGSDHLF